MTDTDIAELRVSVDKNICPNCGIAIIQKPKQKPRRFCCDKCRLTWWNVNRDLKNKKALYTLICVLKNEKYKGDALLQKKYTVDFLSKKQKVNEGEIPQYYVEGSHEGIVSAEVFDLVQYEFQRRKELGRTYSSISPFSSRLICGECGGSYGPKTWHSNDKYRREVYQCNHRHGKRSGEGLGCKTPSLMEDEIKTAFIGAFNSCIKNRKEIIENCKIP